MQEQTSGVEVASGVLCNVSRQNRRQLEVDHLVTLPAPSVQHDQPQVTHFPQKSECPYPAAGKREQNCQLIIIQEQSRPFILAGREPLSPQDTCSRVQ